MSEKLISRRAFIAGGLLACLNAEAGARSAPNAPLLGLPNLDRKWKLMVIHHSATSQGNSTKFDRNHRSRGMENGMAYHFLIGNGKDLPDGRIEIGNRWRRQIQGGHLQSFPLNEVAIGICLIGNFELYKPTPLQIKALQYLVGTLSQKARINEVKLHRDVERTLCPGQFFPEKEFRKFVNKLVHK
jgi:hypothetical protein